MTPHAAVVLNWVFSVAGAAAIGGLILLSFKWIRDGLGIRKDLRESKKTELEIEKLKADDATRKSTIR